MIISDLDHLEVASEESSIVGGTYGHYKKYKKVKYVILKEKEEEETPEEAVAKADASAAAFGKSTFTKTTSDTLAVAGVASFSNSSSISAAKN